MNLEPKSVTDGYSADVEPPGYSEQAEQRTAESVAGAANRQHIKTQAKKNCRFGRRRLAEAKEAATGRQREKEAEGEKA